MKLQKIALAGVAALAMSVPVAASAGTGWYLGLGVGWNHLENNTVTHAPFSLKFESDDSAIFTGGAGYKWDNGFRLEEEIGYTSHTAKLPAGGKQSVTSILINAAWDIPISDRFNFTIGAGFGAGSVKERLNVAGIPALTLAFGNKWSFEWQGIGGIAYEVTPSTDLYVDYRYRSASNNNAYAALAPINPTHVDKLNSQTVMVGLRWYLEDAAPPPAPAAASPAAAPAAPRR